MRLTYSKAALIAILLISLVSFIAVNNSDVQAQTSPDFDVTNVACFTDIYEDNDLYCLVVYDLFISTNPAPLTTPEAWCDELVDKTGCIGEVILPINPGSLLENTVLLELNVSNVLAGVSAAPRIGYSVGGIYFPAGHNITYGDSNVQICVSPNPDLFSIAFSECEEPSWNTAAQNATAQRTLLGNIFKNIMLVKGIKESRPGFYISDDLINVNGSIIVNEALPGAANLLPNTFDASHTTVVIATPTVVATQFADQIAAANPNTDLFYGRIANNTSVTTDGVKAGISLLIGALGFIGGFMAFRNVVFGGLGMFGALTTVAPFDIIYMPGYWAMLGIFAIFAGGYIVKKVVLN